MIFSVSNNVIKKVSVKTLENMEKYGIPVTPSNYTVWFYYTSGMNKELKVEIDCLIKSSEEFSVEVNRELFNKYFGEDKTIGITHDIQKEMEGVIENVMAKMLSFKKGAETSNSNLRENLSTLRSSGSSEDVEVVTESIAAEAGKLLNSSSEISASLHESTEKIKHLESQLEEANKQILTDPLTGIGNRRAYSNRMKEINKNRSKHKENTFLAMIDIDDFKIINDTYGHHIGDEVLKIIGSILKKHKNERISPFRYGGEEFAVTFIESDINTVKKTMENIRKEIASKKFRNNETGDLISKITISIGISILKEEDAPGVFEKRADKALYLAKNWGKNRVVTESELP
ncbi:MAG: GGDEF domain-containing protein [bacterium]